MTDLLFMKMDGKAFDGEEPYGAKPERKMVRIRTYSHGVSQTVAPLRGSVGESTVLRRGAASQHQFVVTRDFDKVSPQLFEAASAGIVFEFVGIYYCTLMPDSKGEKSESKPMLKIGLKNAIIAEFQYGYTDNWPSERLSFAYTSIDWQLKWPDREDGQAGSWMPKGWLGDLSKAGDLTDNWKKTGFEWD